MVMEIKDLQMFGIKKSSNSVKKKLKIIRASRFHISMMDRRGGRGLGCISLHLDGGLQTKASSNAGPILAHCRRRWPSIEPGLGKCALTDFRRQHLVASELKDPICHSDECQIGSFSSESTI